MTAETRKLRIQMLSEIDRLQEQCKPCTTRKRFNDAKDATGLSHACKACQIGQELSQYGNKLLNAL